MSWQQSQPENVATIAYLEERINMYISAMDTASAVNDSHQSVQLQRDIQKLVDLMERVGAGEEIMESQVPPPLAITPQIDVLPNALGELSARLAEYHKALYFAEEELSEDRANKIQGMQQALQAIHNLQKRAEAGFPIRADEVPPPIKIPSDDEFDNDAINTISRRLAQYQEALKTAEQSEGTDRRRIPKIHSTLRTLEFLMTRAKSRRPVWKKDIPPEFEYCNVSPKGSPSMNKTKYLLVIRSLILRLSAPKIVESDIASTAAAAHKKLKVLEEELVKGKDTQPWVRPGNSLPELTKEVENLEKQAAKKKQTKLDIAQDLSLLETRIQEYSAAALKAKKDNEMSSSIKHIKVLKGLQALKKSLERGEAVDMTLVPPAPKDFTPTNESPSTLSEQNETSGTLSRTSQAETAGLLPVNLQSSQETEKAKLAQRLTNYLDCGEDNGLEAPSAEASQPNVAVNNRAKKSTAKLLKKVQNSSVKLPEEKILYGDPGYSDAPMKQGEEGYLKNEDLSQSNVSAVQSLITPNSEKHQAGAENIEENKIEDENSAHAKKRDQETVAVSESSHETSDKSNESKDKEEKHPDPEEITEKKQTPLSSPKASPKSSGDIYSRKTLDSVGFLSCQTVPEDTNKRLYEESNNTSNEQKSNRDLNGACNVENPVTVRDEQLEQTSDPVMPEPNPENQGYTASIISSSKPMREETESEEHRNNNSRISDDQFQYKATVATDSHFSPTAYQPAAADSNNSENGKFREEISVSQTCDDSPALLTSSQDVPSATLPSTLNISSINSNQNENQMTSVQIKHLDSNDVSGVRNTCAQQQTVDLLGVQQNIAVVTAKTTPTSCSSEELEFQDLMASMSASPLTSLEAANDKKNGNEYGIPGEPHHQIKSEPTLSSISAVVTREESFNNNYQGLSNGFEISSSNAMGSGTSNSNTQTTNGHVFPPSQNINGPSSSLQHTVYSAQQGVVNSPSSFIAVAHSSPTKSLSLNAAKFNGPQMNIVFTCLENLKYDLLVEKSKAQCESEEVFKIEAKMDQIKMKLRQSWKIIWELYKTCVESELTSITKEIDALHDHSQDELLLTLQHKQKIAERELKLLQERLPKLRY